MRYIDQQNQQGIVIPLALAAAPQDRRQEVARVRVPAEQARPWRVQLAPIIVAEPLAGVVVDTNVAARRATAVIQWGLGGVFQEVIVDYPFSGGAVIVYGEQVIVTAVVPATWVTGLLPASVTIGAMIVPAEPGARLMHCGHRTFNTGNLIPGAVATIPIPGQASGIHTYQQLTTAAPPAVATIDVEMYMDAALAQPCALIWGVSCNAFVATVGAIVPPDARFVQIRNRDAAATINVQVAFDLDVG